MLQERKGFFYEPELLDYKPVYARPDMNIMLKIIEAGAEKVAHQQDMLNKVEDAVRKTPAYLDQDVDYVGNITKQIDTEISSMMDGTVDLLDPANTGKVMQIAKKYMYDPELAKITSRTGKISKSQEQIEAMRKAGKISAANYWEFSQSILGANEAFAKSKKYNPDVNLHYDIVPYGDPRGENMETLKAMPVHEVTVNMSTPDKRYNYTRTVRAVNPEMQRAIMYAKNDEERAMYMALNDKQLSDIFVNNMSDGAKQQLIAEAKMQGAKTPEEYQAYIQKSVLGVVDMANDADIKDSQYVGDPWELANKQFERDLLKMKQEFKYKKQLQDEDIKARKEAAKKLAEAASSTVDPNRAVPNATTVNVRPESKLGIPFGEGSLSRVRTELATTKAGINSYGKDIKTINANAKRELDAVLDQLVQQGKLSAADKKNFFVKINPVKVTTVNGKTQETMIMVNESEATAYKVVSSVPKIYMDKFPELANVVNNISGVLSTKQVESSSLIRKKQALEQIDDMFTEAGPEVEAELEKIRTLSESQAKASIAHMKTSFSLVYSPEALKKIEADLVVKNMEKNIEASKNPKVKNLNDNINKMFNETEAVFTNEYFVNLQSGTDSPLTRVEYNSIISGMINSLAAGATTKIYDTEGKRIIDDKTIKDIRTALATKIVKDEEGNSVQKLNTEGYINVLGEWNIKVTASDGKTYRMPISKDGTPEIIAKLGLGDIGEIQFAKAIEAEARNSGSVQIPNTDAVYDANYTSVFNSGVSQSMLIISGQAAPFTIFTGNSLDIPRFYNTVEEIKDDPKIDHTTKVKGYTAGLAGLGFRPEQIDVILRAHPQWFNK